MNRILVVEDDPEIATLVRAILRRSGWDVRDVQDGEEAVAMARDWCPQLILLDVDLPGLDGFDVCTAIRRLESGFAPTVVMFAARDDLASKLRGFAAGADDYLVKPIDARELRTRVAHLFGAREAHARAIQERRAEAIHQIVTTICHEVSSPLTAAIGYLDLAAVTCRVSPEAEAHLTRCRRELVRLTDIVERLRHVDDHVVPYVGETTMIELRRREG